MDLTTVIYNLTKKLPKEELFSLNAQMRKAAVSIPSNIAEGQDRNTSKEFAQFLTIARGSKAELETQLLICVKVGYLNEEEISEAMSLLAETGKMLTSLINKLKTEMNYKWTEKTENWKLKTIYYKWTEKTENWKLKTENWKLNYKWTEKNWKLKTENWKLYIISEQKKLKTENWKLYIISEQKKTENWKLKTIYNKWTEKNWKLKTENWKLYIISEQKKLKTENWKLKTNYVRRWQMGRDMGDDHPQQDTKPAYMLRRVLGYFDACHPAWYGYRF